MKKVDEKLLALAQEVAAGLGFEVEALELLGGGRRSVLRVRIDKPGGVTLDDCSAMSNDLSALLDVEDPIPGPYTLEVSSPGMDRPLRDPRAFRKCAGKRARIVLREKTEDGNVLVGTIGLVDDDDEGVTILVGDKAIAVPFSTIAKARLDADLDGHKRGAKQ